MREPLRAKVEKAAKSRGVSMNDEMVERLERSFADEAEAGGPELHQVARLMASTFAHTGNTTSGGKKPSEWLGDPAVYQKCRYAVWNALRGGLKGLTPSAEEQLAFERQEQDLRRQKREEVEDVNDVINHSIHRLQAEIYRLQRFQARQAETKQQEAEATLPGQEQNQ
jgi:hypothetical protein